MASRISDVSTDNVPDGRSAEVVANSTWAAGGEAGGLPGLGERRLACGDFGPLRPFATIRKLPTMCTARSAPTLHNGHQMKTHPPARRLTRILVNVEHANNREDEYRTWWDAALAVVETAPAVAKRLLSGIDVLDVTEEEGREVLAWAERIAGWNDSARKPLLFRPRR